MTLIRICVAVLLLQVSALSQAVIETYEFSDPALEARYKELSTELRCPKCQNQNIADSDAPISRDLRNLLHQQLEEGASDEQILDYMVSRYGEFVRYRPRFAGATAVLWLAPVLLLLIGLCVLFFTVRGRAANVNEAPQALSAEEQQRLDTLLKEGEHKP